MKHFNKIKFASYLIIGLTIFGVLAGANYYNYAIHQEQAQVQIVENVTMIEDTVLDIEMEQQSLEMVQRRLESPPPSSGISGGMSGLISPSAAASSPVRAPASSTTDILQDRIDELEKERIELLDEKKNIVIDIQSFYDIFKFGASNPMVNIVLLPLCFYGGKRALKIVFDKIEEKFEDHHEGDHEA